MSKSPKLSVSKGLFASILKYTSGSHEKDMSSESWGRQGRRGGLSSLKLCVTPAGSCQETTLLAASSLKGLDSCQINLKERLSLSVRAVKKIINYFIVVGT